MKKIITSILVLTLLAGCGSPKNQDQNSDSNNAPQAAQKEDGSKTVEVTYSDSFADTLVALNSLDGSEYTKEDLVKSMNEQNHNATLNEDGSITFSMSKKELDKLKESYKDNVDKAISDFINDEQTGTTITEVSYNGDMSHFDVTVSGNELNLADSFSVITYYLYGGMYSALTGNKNPIITVDFKNKNGEVISSSSSEDLKK